MLAALEEEISGKIYFWSSKLINIICVNLLYIWKGRTFSFDSKSQVEKLNLIGKNSINCLQAKLKKIRSIH